jgi:hypothetical protein
MVVMYEAMYENGDIVTKGFDLVSGKIVPLQALPKQLPSELPDAEPTEEVRALIQSKPEPKESTVSEPPAPGDGGAVATTTQNSLAETATSSQETLDLRSLSTKELIEHLTEKEIATSTIPDLVIQTDEIEVNEDENVTAKSDIPDLVIPSSATTTDTASSSQTEAE